MNPIFHQWKWDFRRIRTLWILWVVLLVGCSYGSLQLTGGDQRSNPFGPLFTFGKYATIYLFALLLITRIMYTTPFAGTVADWKTRPLKQSSLFWSKTIMILGVIFLPVMVLQIVTWQAQNLGNLYIFWASLQFGCLTLSIFLLTAVWSALCDRVGSAWLGMAATACIFAVVVVVYNQLSSRFEALPIQPAGPSYSATMRSSTTLAMMFVFLAAAGGSWILGARFRNPRAASIALLLGITISGGANHIWRLDFFRSNQGEALEENNLTATVLDRNDPVPPDHQLLWNQIAVKVPANQIVQPSTWHTSLSGDSGPIHYSLSSSTTWSQWESKHQQRLRHFYPAGTRLQSRPPHHESLLTNVNLTKRAGHIYGHAAVTIYEWRKIASLPLASKSTVKLSSGGILRVGSISKNELTLVTVTPPQPFRPDDSLNGYHKDYLAHVIYHQESGTAAVAAVNGRGSRFGGTLSKRQSSFSLSLEQDLRTWSLLTKFENLEEGRDSLRLDVFQAVPVGSTVLHWDRRDWLAYHDRPRPTHEIFAVPHPALSRPSLTRTPLPENPTAEQVDRYLDGIPFFLSDYTPHQAQQKIEEDLKAISPQHLDRLLARMPAGLYAEKIIHQVLQTQLSEEHQSAYLQALARDPGLAILAEPLGWQSEAASVLARRLQSHRPLDYSSNGIAIQIVASQADPATFADLRWHFIHAQDNLKSMASSLQKCSGFPFEEALAEAWSRARFEPGNRRTALAPFAARLGEKEALRIAYTHYATEGRAADLLLLSEALDHPGGDLLPGWLHQNFEALTFNQETKTFSLRQ